MDLSVFDNYECDGQITWEEYIKSLGKQDDEKVKSGLKIGTNTDNIYVTINE